MNADTQCPFEDLSPEERRARLGDPSGRSHAEGCADCSTFEDLDARLFAMSRTLPPPPARTRWAYARARWAARNEASEAAAFYGDLVAKLLGGFGAVVALVLIAQALRAGGGATEAQLLVLWVGAVVASSLLLVAVYRTWSET